MTRQLTDEEIEWLDDRPVGDSHSIEGGEYLAACEDCDWTAQGDSFDHLMEQVAEHLELTFHNLNDMELQERKQAFVNHFGWDPWTEGTIREHEEDGLMFEMEVSDGDSSELLEIDIDPEDREWLEQAMDRLRKPKGGNDASDA